MLNQIDLSRADLNLLVVFEAVLAERNVGRAARRLALTPSAISHGLGRLRRMLNDPLFLRTPRGVVPTVRATELAEPIAEILSRVRSVVGTALPFDPAISQRRFVIAMPDAVSAVLLPPLLASVHSVAPGVGFGIRQLLPGSVAPAGGTAWDHALEDLDAREIDIAVGPFHDVPARFVKQTLFAEDFVIASRRGHPYALEPGLRRFCQAHHVLVSVTGQSEGFIDRLLLERGRARRIAVTVPSFMLALALVAETDLIAALPRQLVARHARRFELVATKPPLPLSRDRIAAVTTAAALRDDGVAWLFAMLHGVQPAVAAPVPPRRRKRAAAS